MHLVNYDLDTIELGQTTGFLEIKEAHLQQFGRVHGGVIATILDINMGFAAYTTVTRDQHVVTGELKVSYLRPGKPSRLKVVGTVLKSGKKVVFCEGEVWQIEKDQAVHLIAKASSTMMVIPLDQG